jgi:RNase adaptor protein for sRNA GlmZ degradation
MDLPLIKIVGVSASGKSTLVRALRQAGYNARPVSQEHSHVPELWRQFDWPRYLIYLDADLATQQQRRPDVPWTEAELAEERERLAHALAHADLQINTSTMTSETVGQIALAFLEHHQVPRSPHPLAQLPATGSAHPALDQSIEETVAAQPKRRRKRRGATV